MRKLFALIAAVCCATVMMATNVGDTIPYYYQGDTLWYKYKTTYLTLTTPAPAYNLASTEPYGTHTKPSGVVYVPDSVPVNGVMLPVKDVNLPFHRLQTIDEVYLNNRIGYMSYAFYYSSVKKVHVGSSLISFGNGTFRGCTQLDSVILSDPDQFIDNAWDTWLGSKPVNSLGNNEYLRLGNGVYAYKGFPADSTLTIPDDVKYVAGYLTYPMGSTSAANLRAIVLPAGMTKVGYKAFYYCTGVTKVTCLATVPPTVSDNTFLSQDGTDAVDIAAQATLYVPWSADHSVLAAYQAAEVWKDFSAIVELPQPEPTALEELEGSAAVKRILNGRLVIEKDGVRYNALGQRVRQ